MENKSKEKYYLGLDMGTGSVGWAVTDKNYEIIKKHCRRAEKLSYLQKKNRTQQKQDCIATGIICGRNQ